MDLSYLWYGAVAGLIANLVSSHALSAGFYLMTKRGGKYAFAYGLGTLAPQMVWLIFGAIASYFAGDFAERDHWLSYLGPVILLIFAYMFFFIKSRKFHNEFHHSNPSLRDGLNDLVLTSFNPERLLLYFAIFTSFGMHYKVYYSSSMNVFGLLILGLLISTIMFWSTYILLMKKLSENFVNQHRSWFNHIAAVIMLMLSLISVCGTIFFA